MPLTAVLFATTSPSLSSLVLVTRPDDAGEIVSFCFCAVDAATTRWRDIGAEGVTLERFGRGIASILSALMGEERLVALASNIRRTMVVEGEIAKE